MRKIENDLQGYLKLLVLETIPFIDLYFLGQIRAVLMAPGEESEPFDLELLEINTQQQPKASTVPYAALSYTWGDVI